MNNKLKAIISIFLLINLNFVNANNINNNTCLLDSGVVIAFTNGVATDGIQAILNLVELKKLSINNPNNKNIQYELLYNTSHGLLKDLAETFEQRLIESGTALVGRFELFFEALKGGGDWVNNVTETLDSAKELLIGFVNTAREMIASFLTKLINLFRTTPTKADYIEHDKAINKWLKEKKQILFVGHSQGNLFVNRNYKKIKLNNGINKENNIQVLHVAPASILLNGNYTLVDIDFVINILLKVFGEVVEVNTILDKSTIKNVDARGHGFIETYLNSEVKITNGKFLRDAIADKLNIAFDNLEVCQKCSKVNETESIGEQWLNISIPEWSNENICD